MRSWLGRVCVFGCVWVCLHWVCALLCVGCVDECNWKVKRVFWAKGRVGIDTEEGAWRLLPSQIHSGKGENRGNHPTAEVCAK